MMQITEKSIGLDGAVFADRRAELRRKALKAVRLRFDRGCSTLSGSLRNMSPSGVLIRFGDICAVPPVFELEMAGEKPRRAVVRWRTLTEIGASLE